MQISSEEFRHMHQYWAIKMHKCTRILRAQFLSNKVNLSEVLKTYFHNSPQGDRILHSDRETGCWSESFYKADALADASRHLASVCVTLTSTRYQVYPGNWLHLVLT